MFVIFDTNKMYVNIGTRMVSKNSTLSQAIIEWEFLVFSENLNFYFENQLTKSNRKKGWLAFYLSYQSHRHGNRLALNMKGVQKDWTAEGSVG